MKKIKGPKPWPKVNLFDSFMGDILPKWNPTLENIKAHYPEPKTTPPDQTI